MVQAFNSIFFVACSRKLFYIDRGRRFPVCIREHGGFIWPMKGLKIRESNENREQGAPGNDKKTSDPTLNLYDDGPSRCWY